MFESAFSDEKKKMTLLNTTYTSSSHSFHQITHCSVRAVPFREWRCHTTGKIGNRCRTCIRTEITRTARRFRGGATRKLLLHSKRSLSSKITFRTTFRGSLRYDLEFCVRWCELTFLLCFLTTRGHDLMLKGRCKWGCTFDIQTSQHSVVTNRCHAWGQKTARRGKCRDVVWGKSTCVRSRVWVRDISYVSVVVLNYV